MFAKCFCCNLQTARSSNSSLRRFPTARFYLSRSTLVRLRLGVREACTVYGYSCPIFLPAVERNSLLASRSFCYCRCPSFVDFPVW